jgi:SAM-dependent methyltransferase
MNQRFVFAPDALVRFHAGHVMIATAASASPPFMADRSFPLGWLSQFAAPAEIASVLARVPEQKREGVARAIEYLRSSGALVPVAGPALPGTSAETAHAASRELLAKLAQDLYALACDTAGFGPHAEQALTERTGLGLQQRLQALANAVDGLRLELKVLSAPYLAGQLQALGIGPQSTELKLHIGCGPCHLPGWINLDVHPAPLATNVLWGLPFADGSVRLLYLSHLLEHLFYPHDVQPFLQELHRVLAPGGIVRIVVPDIEQCIAAYRHNDQDFFAQRVQHWGAGDGQPTRLEHFLAYAGAGPDPAYLFEAHKFGYDFETLQRALQRAGFVGIERMRHMHSQCPELQVDAISSTASAGHAGGHYSLFVEAIRPPAGTGA